MKFNIITAWIGWAQNLIYIFSGKLSGYFYVTRRGQINQVKVIFSSFVSAKDALAQISWLQTKTLREILKGNQPKINLIIF